MAKCHFSQYQYRYTGNFSTDTVVILEEKYYFLLFLYNGQIPEGYDGDKPFDSNLE